MPLSTSSPLSPGSRRSGRRRGRCRWSPGPRPRARARRPWASRGRGRWRPGSRTARRAPVVRRRDGPTSRCPRRTASPRASDRPCATTRARCRRSRGRTRRAPSGVPAAPDGRARTPAAASSSHAGDVRRRRTSGAAAGSVCASTFHSSTGTRARSRGDRGAVGEGARVQVGRAALLEDRAGRRSGELEHGAVRGHVRRPGARPSATPSCSAASQRRGRPHRGDDEPLVGPEPEHRVGTSPVTSPHCCGSRCRAPPRSAGPRRSPARRGCSPSSRNGHSSKPHRALAGTAPSRSSAAMSVPAGCVAQQRGEVSHRAWSLRGRRERVRSLRPRPGRSPTGASSTSPIRSRPPVTRASANGRSERHAVVARRDVARASAPASDAPSSGGPAAMSWLPSGSRVVRSTGSRPTRCLRSAPDGVGARVGAAADEVLTAWRRSSPCPASCGVTVPSVSCPTIG